METKQLETRVNFKGKGNEYFGIWIVNILLSVITLGIYSAWAKVRNKRYFYGNTIIGSDSFEYHGKPIQILKGRIIALICVVAWGVSNQFAPQVALVLLLVFFALLPLLSRSNARFDSAMTSFRNVHFSFHGTVSGAYWTILGRGLVVGAGVFTAIMAIIFTMQMNMIAGGIAILISIPSYVYLQSWLLAGIANYFSNGYRYGDRQFKADYQDGFYFKVYLTSMIVWLVVSIVAVLALFSAVGFNMINNPESLSEIANNGSLTSMIVAYYFVFIVMSIAIAAYIQVKIRNYTFSKLVLEGKENEADSTLSFASTLTIKSYMLLVLTNFLLQVITLGLARPWVMVRTMNYLSENTYVQGNLDLLVANDQPSDVESAISDEIAQAFNVDLGIG
ncbi:YjgN family protein [Vibrio lentus]